MANVSIRITEGTAVYEVERSLEEVWGPQRGTVVLGDIETTLDDLVLRIKAARTDPHIPVRRGHDD